MYEFDVLCRSLSGEERGSRLIEAAMKGAVEEVWTLLAAGVDVDARNGERQTALRWTAWERHVEVVRCLVEYGADVDARDIRQNTPLHNAAWRQEPSGGSRDGNGDMPQTSPGFLTTSRSVLLTPSSKSYQHIWSETKLCCIIF
ncbi:ankyrin repeat domain-containing protein 65-like [Schistocerca serialis cubense]|uniref:ankyrin repeat domain-containing protein 65-like n=1 Tax=Schistocerca serialis cubense TaxID=2023355 RepID=UPI00214EE118|nr:ankyrin repeat domain-containing protein 65-like [Schistocerca serialis cubense]